MDCLLFIQCVKFSILIIVILREIDYRNNKLNRYRIFVIIIINFSLEAALKEANDTAVKLLTARVEEVRLEEQIHSDEKLTLFEKEMNEEMQQRILDAIENSKIIMEGKLNELKEEEANHLHQVRERDREKAEREIDVIESEFDEKFTHKQNEIVSLISTIDRIEQELASKDEQIKQLELNYDNSRMEFSHFVDTVTDLGGGYTVRKKIS